MSRRLRARLRALTHVVSTALSTPAGRRTGRVIAHTATVLLMLSVPAAAYADSGATVVLAAASLRWLFGRHGNAAARGLIRRSWRVR